LHFRCRFEAKEKNFEQPQSPRMNLSSESAFGQGGSSASSAIDGEDSIFDRGLTDFMDGPAAGLPTVNGTHNGRAEPGSGGQNSGRGTPTVPLSFSAVDLSSHSAGYPSNRSSNTPPMSGARAMPPLSGDAGSVRGANPGPRPAAAAATGMTRSMTMPPTGVTVPGSTPNPSFHTHQPPGDSSSSNGSNGLAASSELSRFQSRLEDLRKWSLSTYKCTRQIISEKLGKGSRTVDPELEAQIEILRETQLKYLNVLRLARAMWTHFNNVVTTQRQLADSFTELGQKSPELQEEFAYNAETQKALVRNGETLLGALNFFISSINTLCNKTMEDTLTTVKAYETARIEYDAYRNEMEVFNPSITTQPSAGAAPSPSNGLGDASSAARALDTQANFSMHKDKFEKLRSDVTIKLKFLDENKIKVMHKQLLLFHNAISAYFSGNQSALDATLKQFNIKLKVSGDKPSWLEQQ